MSFEVDIDELFQAVERSRGAAGAAKKARPTSTLLTAMGAMPGSTTTRRLFELGEHLHWRVHDWARDADRYATLLEHNAKVYAWCDSDAVREIKGRNP